MLEIAFPGRTEVRKLSDYLRISEAAEYLGVSKSTIIKLSNEGRLQKQRVGRSVRYNANDLDAVRSKPKLDASDPHMRHFL